MHIEYLLVDLNEDYRGKQENDGWNYTEGFRSMDYGTKKQIITKKENGNLRSKKVKSFDNLHFLLGLISMIANFIQISTE